MLKMTTCSTAVSPPTVNEFANPGSRCTTCRQLLTTLSRVSTWCGHQCCENCVGRMTTSSGVYPVCHECSVQPTETTNSGKAGGPMTSFQFSYAPNTNLFSGSSQQQTMCKLCNRKSPELVARCLTCNSEICRDCNHQHSAMSYLASHHVVPLSNSANSSLNNNTAVGGELPSSSSSSNGMLSSSPSSTINISTLVLSSAPTELLTVSDSLREVSRYNLRQFDMCIKSIEETFHMLTDTLERRRSEMFSELKFKFENRLVCYVLTLVCITIISSSCSVVTVLFLEFLVFNNE